MDRNWWKRYHRDVKTSFKGQLFTLAQSCYGIPVPRIIQARNSGAGAIALAASFGAQRVILLGYDCQHTGGKTHWHGNHPPGLGNAGKVSSWPSQFQQLKRQLSGVEVVNASRETALTCFPRMSLSEALKPAVRVLAVLRNGGWCGPEHAQRLAASVPLTLLTDMDVLGVDCLPLQHGWPGWWSKLEICRPDISGDVLYFDLDTMIFGDITPLLELGRDCLLGDFYKPKLESGVMYLTGTTRQRIWKRFTADPEGAMKRCRMDGRFFAECLPGAEDIRKLVSGIHSYKVHGKRDDTRVLCFHGKPRPHETELWQ